MQVIFGADWHFRYSNPKCRTDIYHETISKKLKWLKKLQKKLGIPILNGGDITDKCLYVSPAEVVASINLLEEIPDMIGIIGNHDLLHRSMDYLDKSIISIFIKSGKIKHIDGYYDLDEKTRVFGFDFGSEITHPDPEDLIDGCNIAMWHGYVSKEFNPLFGKVVARDLLEEFPEFNILLTGDNHIRFIEEMDGRFLINPGSFLRMSANQIDFEPAVFVIDTDEMSYEMIKVPIEVGVISTEHIQIEKDRDDRIESFVTNLDEEYEITDAFEKNLENYIAENKHDENNKLLINKNVEKFINRALEGDIG